MDEQKLKQFYSSDRNNTKKVFVSVMTTDGKHFFLPISIRGMFDGWRERVKEHCKNNNVFVQDLHLRFRTNRAIIDVEGADALYLIRAARGSLGGPTHHFIVVGIVKGDKVTKHFYAVPELLHDHEETDWLSTCNPEALIYREETQKNRKEQVQA
jgi:hypothetical protein